MCIRVHDSIEKKREYSRISFIKLILFGKHRPTDFSTAHSTYSTFFLSVVFLYSLWQAVMLDSSGSSDGGSCSTVCRSDAVHLFCNSLNFQWVFISFSLLNQFVDARKFDIKATCNHLFEWWRGPPLFVKSNLQMDLNDGSLTLLSIKEVGMFFFVLFFCLANPFHFFAFQFIEETFMILSKLIFRPKWFIRL